MSLIDQLEQAGKEACPHSGHCTVVAIVNYLRKGNLQAAQNVYQVDGDKLGSYPKIKNLALQLLGCRSHLKHNCKHFFCEKLQTLSCTIGE